MNNDIYLGDDGAEIDRNKIISRKFAQWRRNRKPTTAALLEKRLDSFFEFCEQYDVLPDLEKMALCVGCDRSTLYRWRGGRGCSREWQIIIERAVQQIYACISNASDDGKLSPVMGIWKMKNQMSYSDSKSLEEQALSDSRYNDAYQAPIALLQKYSLPDTIVSDAILHGQSVPQRAEATEIDYSAEIPDEYF